MQRLHCNNVTLQTVSPNRCNSYQNQVFFYNSKINIYCYMATLLLHSFSHGNYQPINIIKFGK